MRASLPTSLLYTPPSWSRPYGDGWFEVREGRRRNPEPLFSARLRVHSHERQTFWSVPYRKEFSELNYPAHILRLWVQSRNPLRRALKYRLPETRLKNSPGVSAGSPSSLCAHEHPLRTFTASRAIPTLPVEPVVIPQPPVNVTGASAHRRGDETLVSSSRTGSEPRAPVYHQSMGAERATSSEVSPTRDNAPPPVTVRPTSRPASANQCPL